MRAIIEELEGHVEPDVPPQQNPDSVEIETEDVPELERMRFHERTLERRRARLKAD